MLFEIRYIKKHTQSGLLNIGRFSAPINQNTSVANNNTFGFLTIHFGQNKIPFILTIILAISALNGNAQNPDPQQGLRADWLRGTWGINWKPVDLYNGGHEGLSIEPFLDQISHLRTIDYIQVHLGESSIKSSVHMGPHPLLESLWEGDTDGGGNPINLVVPRASFGEDPFLEVVKATRAAGMKVMVYVNSSNMLSRDGPDGSNPSYIPNITERWKEWCDTNAEAQAFIASQPYHTGIWDAGSGTYVNAESQYPERKYMFCYAEFVLKVYAERYGDLLDGWCFDSGSWMGKNGDSATNGIYEDQMIFNAFKAACHAGNPNAALSFQNSPERQTEELNPFSEAVHADDFMFGHPYNGGNDGGSHTIGTPPLYDRNYAHIEKIKETNGNVHSGIDPQTWTWDDKVVGHYDPPMSTSSWNGGNTPALTNAEFNLWNLEAVQYGGAISWGLPLVSKSGTNEQYVANSWALDQLNGMDAHLMELESPGAPNWSRAHTILPEAVGGAVFSHDLVEDVDFWDPEGDNITGLVAVAVDNPPSWLSISESSGTWTLSGTPDESVDTEYTFRLRVSDASGSSDRWVNLNVTNSGADFITNHFTNKGVFNTPNHELTSAYDELRVYDNIQGLTFDALDYDDGSPTKVFCWYGVPEGLEQGQKAPAVVLVHGGGGTAFPEWVHQWNERGYIAIAIAHEGQLPGTKDPWYPTWEYSGPRRAGFFKDADEAIADQWFHHAIADAILANSLLRSFPEVDDSHIGINGVSWGGVLTNVITGIDQRFAFSIPVYGCGFLWDSPKYKVDMELNTEAELDFYFANWDPSIYLPLQDLPVFYVNGSQDKQFAMNIATRTYNQMPSEKYLRIQNPMTHSTAAAYATTEVYEFADYITQNGSAPVKISIDELVGNTLTASYQGSVESAQLVYITDTLTWVDTEISWQETAAQVHVGSSQVTASLPSGTQAFFINIMTADGFLYSSPMETIGGSVDPGSEENEVHIIADANTNYGLDQVATFISSVQIAQDEKATFQISCDITPLSGTGIMSGPGGGESIATDWGISASSDVSDIQNVIFRGSDNEMAEIGNIKVVNFNANGGELTVDSFIELTFKGVMIVNAQSPNKDAVALTINDVTTELQGSSDISQKFTTIELESATGASSITNFSIGTGDSPSQTQNKWSVGDIVVKYKLDGFVLSSSAPETNLNDERIRIYPNPVADQLIVERSKGAKHAYSLMDFSGRTLLKGVLKENRSLIDVSDLKSGLYILRVDGRTESFTRTIKK